MSGGSSQPSSVSVRPQVGGPGASSDGLGILYKGQVPDFKAALWSAMKGVALDDREVLARRSPAHDLNTAMIGLVEVLHYQMAYTCRWLIGRRSLTCKRLR